MSLDSRPSRFLAFPPVLLLLLSWITTPSPLAAEEIEVTSADPPAAEQATFNLDVVIKGNGFGRDARVDFYWPDTEEPRGVRVNRVKVKGPKTLVANIDVAGDAKLGSRDIVVHSNGRKGEGTELFAVLKKGSGAQGNLDVPLKFEFGDFLTLVANIKNDNFGVLPYADGDYHVDAWIGDDGNKMMFNTTVKKPDKGDPVRKVFFDFSVCKDGACFAPFSPSYQDEAPIIGWNMVLLGAEVAGAPGVPGNVTWSGMSANPISPLHRLPALVAVFFTDHTDELYLLRFNPKGTGPQLSRYAMAECESETDGRCTQWRVYSTETPDCPPGPCCTDPDGAPSKCLGNWAVLHENRPRVYRGVYYMDFEMTIEVCGDPGDEGCSW